MQIMKQPRAMPMASLVTGYAPRCCSKAKRYVRQTICSFHFSHGAALSRVVGQSRRANEVFDGIRDLFRKVGQSREPLDVNELICDALQSLNQELSGSNCPALGAHCKWGAEFDCKSRPMALIA